MQCCHAPLNCQELKYHSWKVGERLRKIACGIKVILQNRHELLVILLSALSFYPFFFSKTWILKVVVKRPQKSQENWEIL